MTRRIALAIVGLVAALLLFIVVPLGLISAQHERSAYRASAVATARAVAGVAEERVADREPDPALRRFLRDAASGSDGIVVLDNTGRRTAAAGDVDFVPPRLRDAALHGRTGSRWYVDDGRHRLGVAVPILSAHGITGAVLLTRSAAAVDGRIRGLWLRLLVAAVIAQAAAGGLAFALARWVGRPIRRLSVVADDLGTGDLEARALTTSGPAEVRHLADRFNAMAERLQDLVADHRAVAADVSHQLRTPLAALRLRLELLRSSADEPSADELDAALAETARLSKLVDGLLAVARAENADRPREPVDLRAVAEDRVGAWSAVARDGGVALVVDEAGAEAPAVAVLSTGALEQVLDNLIDNALTVTPKDGLVRIAVDATSGRVGLTVTDTGPGIPAERRRAVLHRYASDRGGAGLGLAIVDRLVRADGGTLELGDAPDGGLRVDLSWPRSTEDRQRGRELSRSGGGG